MARQLTARGERVAELVLLDTPAPGVADMTAHDASGLPVTLTLGDRLAFEAELLREHGLGSLASRLASRVTNVLRRRRLKKMASASPALARSQRVAEAWLEAAMNYRGGPYSGVASLVLSRQVGLRERKFTEQYPYLGWDGFIDATSITRKNMVSSHYEMLKDAEAIALADFIEARIVDR
jgi:thioesterase domain-containing protein